MTGLKIRKRVTLDAEVVEALGADPRGFSTTVNDILHDEIGRRADAVRQEGLLGRPEESLGAQDPERVAYFQRLFNERPGE
jgi:hypothetical protein